MRKLKISQKNKSYGLCEIKLEWLYWRAMTTTPTWVGGVPTSVFQNILSMKHSPDDLWIGWSLKHFTGKEKIKNIKCNSNYSANNPPKNSNDLILMTHHLEYQLPSYFHK